MTKSPDFVNEKRNFRLGNSADNDGRKVILRELGTADVEGVESVRAIGAVLQEVFFRFRHFLPSFVLAKAVKNAQAQATAITSAANCILV